MSSMRQSDSDGSDIFWPGYVDAVTNLVLNLLFLLTIMTVAVFMFALELGRASMGGNSKPHMAAAPKDVKQPAKAAAGADGAAKENLELKREIQRLNQQLARLTVAGAQPASRQKADSLAGGTQPSAGQKPGDTAAGLSKPLTGPDRKSGITEKSLDVTASMPKPLNRLDKTHATSDTDIIVRFTDEAVAFTPAEHDRLRELLKPVVAKGRANVTVDVPAGFSEARRMGFYRAMAVRNLLLEMKMPKGQINVSVREATGKANAAHVRVKAD